MYRGVIADKKSQERKYFKYASVVPTDPEDSSKRKKYVSVEIMQAIHYAVLLKIIRLETIRRKHSLKK